MQKPTPSALHQVFQNIEQAAKLSKSMPTMPCQRMLRNIYECWIHLQPGRSRLHCPLRRWDTMVDTIRQADTAIPDSSETEKVYKMLCLLFHVIFLYLNVFNVFDLRQVLFGWAAWDPKASQLRNIHACGRLNVYPIYPSLRLQVVTSHTNCIKLLFLCCHFKYVKSTS